MNAPAASTFKTHEPALQELLESIHKGEVQLPDFQRGWVWDDDRIRALVASVSMSYPVGVVMLLETGGEGGRFKPRLVEGVPATVTASAQKLILDGQQRLTSLYRALRSGQPVLTRTAKGADIKRVYYLHMAGCLDSELERVDAVFSLPPDRMRKSNFDRTIELDVSSREKEYEQGLVPLDIFFDMIAYNTWKAGYLQRFSADPARFRLLLEFDAQVWQRFFQYRVPVIELVRDTPKEAVCQVFEKVNTGGVSLNVFELLTATFAADNYEPGLRKDWEGREKRLRHQKVLGQLENTEFLQAITLVATQDRRLRHPATGKPPESAAPGVSCKRKDILRLTLDEYSKWADPLTEAFERSAKFLNALRIYHARDLPYHAQLAPLAAILTALGKRADDYGVRAKIGRWYWCGVFGELYGGGIESRLAKDLPEVLAFVENDAVPATITDANFAPARLLTMRSRNSAAYKGLHALLMHDGCLDFRTGYAYDLQRYFDERTDIHHIFPQAWCKAKGVDAKRCDSIVNKTPISAGTNRMIGGKAPSDYLTRLQKSAGIEPARMDEILRSHLIDPAGLRADDFDRFFEARSQALLEKIVKATGMTIAREAVEEDVPEAVEYETEEAEVA